MLATDREIFRPTMGQRINDLQGALRGHESSIDRILQRERMHVTALVFGGIHRAERKLQELQGAAKMLDHLTQAERPKAKPASNAVRPN